MSRVCCPAIASGAAVVSLLCYAVVLVITPACNNELSRDYGLSYAQLGQLSLATMLGFFLTVIPAGIFADRWGKLLPMTFGCFSMASGCGIFALANGFGWLVLGAALFGIGGGLSEANSMALLADLYEGSKRSAAMNLAQAMFGIGAVIAPFGIGWILHLGGGWRSGYYGAGLVCFVGMLINMTALLRHREPRLPKHEHRSNPIAIATDSSVLVLAISIFLYVGAEIGQSTWLSVYFKRYLGASSSLAASSPSFLWLGIGIGRLLAAVALRVVHEGPLVRTCLAFAALCQAVLVISRAPASGGIAAFCLGLFLGPIFPTIVSRANAVHPIATGSVSSIVMAAGSLGAAVFPPFIGLTAEVWGLRQALWVCFGLLCVNFVLVLLVRDTDTP